MQVANIVKVRIAMIILPYRLENHEEDYRPPVEAAQAFGSGGFAFYAIKRRISGICFLWPQLYTELTMSASEQSALPFYEDATIRAMRYPWASFDDVANQLYPVMDVALDELAERCETDDPGMDHLDARGREIHFAQKMLAYAMRCDQLASEHMEDGTKYNLARNAMILRECGVYERTGHFIDCAMELRYLKAPLADSDPLLPFVCSAITSLQLVRPCRSEPPKEVSYAQISLLDE